MVKHLINSCTILSLLLLFQKEVFSSDNYGSSQYFDNDIGSLYPNDQDLFTNQFESYDGSYDQNQFTYNDTYNYTSPSTFPMDSSSYLYPSQYSQDILNDYLIDNTNYVMYPDSFTSFPDVLFNDPTETERITHLKDTKHTFHPPNVRTTLLDISNRKDTKFVTYEFDQKSNTHIFKANEGYLFEAAIDENADQVWESTNNRYADKITVQETGPGDFSIKVFVPVEGTSGSEPEFDKSKPHSGRILDKTPKYEAPIHEPLHRPYEPPKHLPSQLPEPLPSPKPLHSQNLIHIELKERRSTDKFHYHYNNRYCIHSFKPRTGYNIGKVTYNNVLKYKYDGGECPDEVIVIELTEGGESVRVIFPTPEIAPKEPPKEPARPTLVKVDVKNFASTEGVKYRYDEKTKIHRFICRDNYLIRKIIKGDKTLREFSDPNYPDRLLILPVPGDKPFLRILYPGQDEGHEKPPERKPVPQLPEPEPPVKEPPKEVVTTPLPSMPGISLISVDVKRFEDTDMIEFKEEKDGTKVFTCKPGFLIRKIKKDNEVLEEFKEEYPNKITVSVDRHGKKLIDVSYPYKPELFTLDIRTKKSTDKFEYERDHYKKRDVYTAKKPFLFYEVRNDNELLWYSRDGRYPEKVLIIPVEGKKPVLRVYYPRDAAITPLEKIAGYKPDIYKTDQYEEPSEKPEPTKPKKIEEEPRLPKPSEAIVRPSDIDIVDTVAKPTEIYHPVLLNLSHQKHSDELSFTTSGHIGHYKANVGYAFDGVNKDNDVIWRANNPKEYAYQAFADGFGYFSQINNVTIYQLDDSIKHFHKHKQHDWIIIPPLLELNIEHKSNTLHVNCLGDGKHHMFVANHNFVFNKIFEGKQLIWDSQRLYKCKKVLYEEQLKHYSHDKELTIFLDDGIISLRRDKKTGQWVDLSSTDVIKATIDSYKRSDLEIMREFNENYLKILTSDPNDFNRRTEIEEHQYEKTVERDEYTYDLKDETKCLEVKYKNETFWNYDYDKHGILYPKRIQFQKELLLIVVDFGIISLKYKFDGNTIKLVYIKKPAPVEIDLQNSDGLSQDITGSGVNALSDTKSALIRHVENGFVTYTTHPHFAINPVRYGPQILIETNDPFSYVVKVKAKPEHAPERFYAILLNGKKKNFSKSTDEKWTQLPSDMNIFN